ncbi:rod-binding protein [Sphingobium algorifonticola]|uniref:Flagellar biosynthesis protein FlgI n=1 Tax=Sphingobium algorifonticola TaxID=2008318 RepID=A0A437JBS6_9SPHN|nr:rod-binding protein [Sphingobium algorifonticola]RVT43357.1 flagellar biosynthesis protein FlgI [Sphingobium algorifonticola]
MTQIAFPSAASGAGRTAASPDPQAKAQLEKTAKAFEAIFLRQMIATMRSSSLGEGLTDNGESAQFRDMADARTADNMAETGKFGIAELLVKHLTQTLPTDPATKASPDGSPA